MPWHIPVVLIEINWGIQDYCAGIIEKATHKFVPGG